jgi:uncharacterized protein YggU (UPF0235/DUF167 family)
VPRNQGAGVTGPDRRGRPRGEAAEPERTTIAVRVRPGSSRPRVGGRFDGPYGPALVISVSPPAVDGRATEAARLALAQALSVRPAEVDLRTGAASRDKLFTVAVPAATLDARLRRLRDGPAE